MILWETNCVRIQFFVRLRHVDQGWIQVEMKWGILNIRGQQLQINQFDSDEMLIKGDINLLEKAS